MPPLGTTLAETGLNVSVRNTFLHCDEEDEAGDEEIGQPEIPRSKTAPEYRKLGSSEAAQAGLEPEGGGADRDDEAGDEGGDDEGEASSTESSDEAQPTLWHQDTYDGFDNNPATLAAVQLSERLPPATPPPEVVARAAGNSGNSSGGPQVVAAAPGAANSSCGAAYVSSATFDALGTAAPPLRALAEPLQVMAEPLQVAAPSAAPMLLGRRGGDPAGSGAPADSGVAGKATRSTAGRDHSRTTVMLRNLPNNYTRAALLDLIDQEGFTGRYDFVYLPIDFKTHAALGYAFLNMVTPEDAERLRKRLDGFSRWSLPSSKVCNVGWSHPHQGLESHVQRYRNSPLMHEAVPDAYRPALFSNGVRVPFPPPTKKIKPPRQGTQRMLV